MMSNVSKVGAETVHLSSFTDVLAGVSVPFDLPQVSDGKTDYPVFHCGY